MKSNSTILFLVASLATWAALAAAPAPKSGPVALGKVDPFWRYSAVLGPHLESGYALLEIPDYLLQGDFAYRKRPFPKEVPFADHLSVVRVLGGYTDGRNGPPIPERDLAYRDANGRICYRMELLKPRLQPYLEQGYTNLTIVLDNTPWCFPAKTATGQYGHR